MEIADVIAHAMHFRLLLFLSHQQVKGLGSSFGVGARRSLGWSPACFGVHRPAGGVRVSRAAPSAGLVGTVHEPLEWVLTTAPSKFLTW